MYEVEVKVRAAHDPVRGRLAELGADPRGAVRQRDTYYDHPGRSFAETDEALRLRREVGATGDHDDPVGAEPSDGSPALAADEGQAILTYKGPRVDNVAKTRREVETGVGDPDALDGVLRAVGFEPAAEVRKVRERFVLAGFDVALDRVAGLGEFVEVEAEAAEDELDARRRGALDLLAELGLDPAEATPTSYLALLLEEGGAPAGPGDGATGPG